MQTLMKVATWMAVLPLMASIACVEGPMEGSFDAQEGTKSGQTEQIDQKIIRGEEVPAGKYPWMAYTGGCTGSLISPRFIISAAHCLARNRNEQGTLEGVEIAAPPIRFGHPDIDNPLIQRPQVAAVHMHPEYLLLTLEEVWGLEPYDVVLLELEEPILLDQYLRLPTRAPVVDEEIIAAGWGLSEDGPVRHLREATLFVRDHNSCFRGDEKRFCTRGNADNSNIWSGDSGGPVFVPDGDGFMLLGTNSTSNGDTANTFASHARISTFVPWILSIAADDFVCSGEGDEQVCEADLNECQEGLDDCGTEATCQNTVGGFECVCEDGYQSDGQNCLDIDECTDGPGCGDNEVCTNLEGSFECACAPGFRDDGQGCVDVDECVEGPGCGENEACSNTEGGFECNPTDDGGEDDQDDENNDGDDDVNNDEGDMEPTPDDANTGANASSGCSVQPTSSGGRSHTHLWFVGLLIGLVVWRRR